MKNTEKEITTGWFYTLLLGFALGLFIAALIACPWLLDESELLWRN